MADSELILIVEDDGAFRKLLILKLKSFLDNVQFIECTSLADARTCLASAKNLKPSLVVLDQHLPDGRGLELLNEGLFQDLAVLAVSSDEKPSMAGETVQAGAGFFLNKRHITDELFEPLVRGLIERNKIQDCLNTAKLEIARLETVKTLVDTLRHEINNPLGAVLGGAYLLKNDKNASSEQKEAAALVENSGKRIKHVLEELCKAVSLEQVVKASHKVFQIPGDEDWK